MSEEGTRSAGAAFGRPCLALRAGGRGKRAALVGSAITVIAVLAGCETLKQVESRTVGTGPNLEAALSAIGGSAVTGIATLRAYDGGVTLSLSFAGTRAGAYRVAVHANGNCTSPNGFSAGPPWAPPGVVVASPLVMKSDYSATLVVRLPGYVFEGPDGVRGRSVVVHAGSSGSLEAEPGIPNDRVACGVIGVPRSLLPPPQN